MATPLINRLRIERPAVFGGIARQDHDLTGPVRVVPYVQTAVRCPLAGPPAGPGEHGFRQAACSTGTGAARWRRRGGPG